MQRPIIVRGRLNGSRRIDLVEALDEVSGAVEVVVRSIEPTPVIPPAQAPRCDSCAARRSSGAKRI
ncbi:MAG: hypothetical protein IPG17_32110 [Sandaracinaceae bacterium]|nr:hypothetical protein [Sandaracinaceae bacterium]